MREHRESSAWRSGILAVATVIALAAWWTSRDAPASSPPWYSIVPPLLAIALALSINRILVCLAAAVVTGGLLRAVCASSTVWPLGEGLGLRYLYAAAADATNVLILLYVVLIMAMIAVMLAAGGLQGVAAWLMRFARTDRSTQLVTALAGLIIFIDDYANTMIVGSTMRPLTDRQRISREKLAFLVDATAAPIAGIAVVSTWIGVEVGLLTAVAGQLGIDGNGYAMFFDALPYRFYCAGMIAFVLLTTLAGVDFGPMAAAQRRARTTGKLLADGARPLTSRSMTAVQPDPAARVRASVALVPMAVLLGVFLVGLWLAGGGEGLLAADPWGVFRPAAWRAVLGQADSVPLLAWASYTGLAAAAVLAVLVARAPLASIARAGVLGVRSSLMPVAVLLLAWSLKGVCHDLQTGEFLAELLGDRVPPAAFGGLVFVVAAVTSFATGTSWGTMAILIPTAIPVAFALDGDAYGPVTILSIAAVLDGAIFGDHCSPISDTTIMSSTASACDHLAHVRTQMPYSLTVAAVALAASYPAAALGGTKVAVVLIGPAVLAAIILGLRMFSGRQERT